MIISLTNYDQKTFSQNGEDGVLDKLVELFPEIKHTYVEFGTENGTECNTRKLRERAGWTGLMMDGNNDNPSINLHKEFITAENINELFRKYQVPFDLGILSIDIDANDFYVWYAISEKYQPSIVVIEYNASHDPTEDKLILYRPDTHWDGKDYYGASLLGYYKLGRAKGYSLVYCENRGVNAFFIRDEILKGKDFTFESINDVSKIYKLPRYDIGPKGGHIKDPFNRLYIEAETFLTQNPISAKIES